MSLYHSTLGLAPAVDFETAVLQGFAPDGGLYVPAKLPQVTHQQLEAWKGLSYPYSSPRAGKWLLRTGTIPRPYALV